MEGTSLLSQICRIITNGWKHPNGNKEEEGVGVGTQATIRGEKKEEKTSRYKKKDRETVNTR